jgi:hypothetical protein
MMQPDKGAAVPKFGDWDVSNPASANERRDKVGPDMHPEHLMRGHMLSTTKITVAKPRYAGNSLLTVF